MPIVDEPGADVLQAPLDAGQLARRWKEMLADPALARVAGKVELDAWGRIIVMSPVDPLHGNVAGRLCMLLIQQLGGRALVEVGVLTAAGVLAPDVVWCSEPFWRARRDETPWQSAPEICVEISSPSNSLAELRGKVRAYLDAGATEAWLVFPRSKRIEFHGASGALSESAFRLDLGTLFD